MTYDGRRIEFPTPKSRSLCNPTFSRERRFMQYYIDQKKTNVVVGPSTYHSLEAVLNIVQRPCAVKYVKFIIDNIETFISCKRLFRGIYYGRSTISV